ncbi:hypothetical protein GCM10010099_22740 [Streptomyces cinereus]|nr:hypothetical protein GCM10010099_22740 [Streptomyces cinereus]
MARFALTGYDRISVSQARETLVEAERLDMADQMAVARMVGKLEAAVKSLLAVLEGDGAH